MFILGKHSLVDPETLLNAGQLAEAGVVSVEPQTFDPAQQAQARANIGVTAANLGAGAVGEAVFESETVAEAQAAIGQVVRVKTADQTSTTTSWADVTDLSFPVLSGETWVFETDIWAQMTNSASNTEAAFNGPAASDFRFRRIRLAQGATAAVFGSEITAYDSGTSVAGQNETATALLRGMATFSASGNLTLRMRRSAAAGTATINSLSILRATRIT